jgi:secreted PhoX family phosphatase
LRHRRRTGGPLLDSERAGRQCRRGHRPRGYTAQAIAAWGEPVGISGEDAPFRFDAGNTAAQQEAQLGMHHDGSHYYPLPRSADPNATGLLVMNHEYVDDGLLHGDGMKTWTAAKVKKAQAAHGISVIEVARRGDTWQIVRPSPWARRITANTPIALRGPAASHALLRTAADPGGRRVLGTLNNCASGITPWGTYLTCEENFINYFKGPDAPSAHEQRWGLRKGAPAGYRWPSTTNGSMRPSLNGRTGSAGSPVRPLLVAGCSAPRLRSRAQECTVATTQDGRAVVCWGEDAPEHIYSSSAATGSGQAARPRHALRRALRTDGSGRWLPLVHGNSSPAGCRRRLRRPGCEADPRTPGERRAGRD